MAAHVLRALKELRDGECTVEQFRHGLSHAQFGDNLDWNDWLILKDTKDDEQFKKLAVAMIKSYEKVWTQYGKPATAEEWLERRNHV